MPVQTQIKNIDTWLDGYITARFDALEEGQFIAVNGLANMLNADENKPNQLKDTKWVDLKKMVGRSVFRLIQKKLIWGARYSKKIAWYSKRVSGQPKPKIPEEITPKFWIKGSKDKWWS